MTCRCLQITNTWNNSGMTLDNYCSITYYIYLLVTLQWCLSEPEIAGYTDFSFLNLKKNPYAPASPVNWCNMTFTAGNLFLSRSLGDLGQAPIGIWTRVNRLRGGRLTNWAIPPPSQINECICWMFQNIFHLIYKICTRW